MYQVFINLLLYLFINLFVYLLLVQTKVPTHKNPPGKPILLESRREASVSVWCTWNKFAHIEKDAFCVRINKICP